MVERADRYALTQENDLAARSLGLADTSWYLSPVERTTMRKLLRRDDWPAIRDTVIWFSILGLSGVLGFLFWGTWWAILPFTVYGVIYASTSDSRWHESGHGTAFRTDWMNNALYEIASFMVFRESIPWRWSHIRHHTDTIVVGRDPEIQVPRPANLRSFFLGFFGITSIPRELGNMYRHAIGRISSAEKLYIPESEFPRIFVRSRICLLIYGGVVTSAVALGSWLPLMYIGLPTIYGGWLMRVYGHTQHTGLAENVTDYRLNTRTVYMNCLNRFLYWNMNYHIEHHMYPMVPYHALPTLHEEVKADCPAPYPSLLSAWSEIIPAVLRQSSDPSYFVHREIPEHAAASPAASPKSIEAQGAIDPDGWIRVCRLEALQENDVRRFDHDGRSIAIYRLDGDDYYATDGFCTHGNTHLSNGLVIGAEIECPKHNGRFNIRSGRASRVPACVALRTHEVQARDGWLHLRINADSSDLHKFRVVSNRNVATYIKELVLAPESGAKPFTYKPGDYIQLVVPRYAEKSVTPDDISPEFRSAWSISDFDVARSSNPTIARRNYSMGSNPALDKLLRFNIRLAAAPVDGNCSAGVGSTFAFQLKPGDEVSVAGPFGSFHIVDSDREMIYLGGGSGMAPLRSHISHLLETLGSKRRIGYWYGARSESDLFYRDYFEDLAEKHPNFTFHVAFSEQGPDSDPSRVGYIHEVLYRDYLKAHQTPTEVEYYLCGPPPMIRATMDMLVSFGVPSDQVRFDEF